MNLEPANRGNNPIHSVCIDLNARTVEQLGRYGQIDVLRRPAGTKKARYEVLHARGCE